MPVHHSDQNCTPFALNLSSSAATRGQQLTVDSTGIVIQPTEMQASAGRVQTVNDSGGSILAAEGSKAPLFILAPRLIKRYAHQSGGSAWPAQPNVLTFSFTPTVDMKPISGARISVVISGLRGIDEQKPSGSVTLGGASAQKFTDCPQLNASCVSSRALWDQTSKTLTMNVLAAIDALTDITVRV